jgi:hypothetical protein
MWYVYICMYLVIMSQNPPTHSILPLSLGEPLPSTLTASRSLPLPTPSPPMESSPSPLTAGFSSPSDSGEEPIPISSNHHTGAYVSQPISSSSLLMLPTHAARDSASFTSPGPNPILPRRFNDDIIDSHIGSAHSSPAGERIQRTVSVPSSPSYPEHTGNAPAVVAAAAAAAAHSHHHTATKGCHHSHRTRFDHTLGDDGGESAERDAQEVPEVRPLYKKNENGVFQFAASAHLDNAVIGGAATGNGLMLRNRSNQNLQSLAAPAGGGAGPRAPPVNLISSSLAASTITRTTSGESSSFHPHGTEKLPYNRVVIDYAPSTPSIELKLIGTHIRRCLELRAKFVWTPLRSEKQYDIFVNPPYNPPSMNDPLPDIDISKKNMHFEFRAGVFSAWCGDKERTAKENQLFEAPNRADFGEAMATVMDLVISGPAKTFRWANSHTFIYTLSIMCIIPF